MNVADSTLERRNEAIRRLGVLERAGDPALTALTRVLAFITGAQGAAVHILDDRVQRRIAATGAPLEETPREDSMCRLVVDADERIVCEDATADPRFGYSSYVRGISPVRFYASLPLHAADGTVVGALCSFDTREITLDAEQIERFEDLADEVSARIELTQIAAELGDAATHDPLTGAVNRLLLDDRLAQAFARRHRRGGETLLGVIDVDDFKSINDRHGHPVGDAVLREVVARLRRALREEDTVARIGGDEFVIVAELTPPGEDENAIASRIAARFAEPMRIDDLKLAVRVSLGCVLAGPEQPLRDLIAQADQAMYARRRRIREPVAGR